VRGEFQEPTLPVVHFAHLVETGTWFAVGGVVGGAVLSLLIRLRGWSWTCGLPLLAVPEASLLSWGAELCADAFAVAAVRIGAWRHLADLRAGGDLAQRARDRAGPMASIRRWYRWRKLRIGQWVTSQGVVIGFTRKGELVRVPLASRRAVMSLLLGATRVVDQPAVPRGTRSSGRAYTKAPARSRASTLTSCGKVIVRWPSRSRSRRALMIVTPMTWPSSPYRTP
jgi:hypothetical protein